jgi:hypothetical protein
MSLPPVHLGVDVNASPLWLPGNDGKLENHPLCDLQISADLARDLEDWASDYDRLVYSHGGVFPDEMPATEAFDRRGAELWRQLVDEIGSDREVHYDSPLHGESHLVHRPFLS